MSQLNKEMLQWLTDNREDYEFYMLHAMMHDPLRRISLLTVPVTQDDFRREEYTLVIRALETSSKIMGIIGQTLTNPPTVEFLRTYIESAGRELSSDDEMVDEAVKLTKELQDPSYCEQHYCVGPYFEAWYGSMRAKKAARKFMEKDIPDVHEQVGQIQLALSSASQAVDSEEEDGMDTFLDGDDLERSVRRPTGIAGLDACLNGGSGDGECYLLFGGTGGGKSIAAGQMAWNEAEINSGWPLVVSTELLAREYAVRTVSNAAGISINIVQDCENIAQIRQAIASDPGSSYKITKADKVLDKIRERIRIHKVTADEGMEARMMLEREVMKYEDKTGHMPTWVCLDWLGSVADLGGKAGQGTSERAMAWEMAASGCVRFAEDTGIPTYVLAQATNDAQLKPVLTINDIGISKGIAKNMVAAIGITNTLDKAGIAAAVTGKADMPRSMVKDDQLFCVCKARKGEGRNVPVRRDFRFQRFTARPKDND